jgi:glycosyltransferase involved in cell wall biosynthesis
MTTRRPHQTGGRRRSVLWVSTSLETRGGVSSFVRGMSTTPLWHDWNVTHVATHRDGTTRVKIAQFLRSIPRFVYLLVRDRPTVVHLHVASRGSFFRKFTFSSITRLAGVPVITHVHGAQFDAFHDNAPRPVKWAIRNLLRHSAVVIALGESWATRLTAIEPDAEIMVVANPVRPGQRVAQPAAGAPLEVLFLGRLEERKGVWCLIEAWRDLQSRLQSGRPARLTLAGDGDVDRARVMVRELGLTDTVTVTGWVDSQDVPTLLRSSHVLVLPSHDEGQPMAVLEAMANGLCVIACPVGGVPDLIDDGCGILVPPGDRLALADALADVVTDDGRRERLGGAAHGRIEGVFDIDVAWRRFDRLYEGFVR